MSPQCNTKRSIASGSFSVFSIISVMTEISQTTEAESSCPEGGRELGKTLLIIDGYDRRLAGGHWHSPRQRWSRAGWPRPRPEPHAFRQGFVQHQHLADRLRGDKTDETSAAVDHGDGGSGFFLQHAEC